MSNPHNVEPDPLSDMGEDTPNGLDRDDVVEDLRDGWRKAAAKRNELQEKLEALKFCPFCATAFEPPPGWLHDRCPGCRRAEWAQAERDEWKRGAETYGRELAAEQEENDRLKGEHDQAVQRLASCGEQLRAVQYQLQELEDWSEGR